MSEQSRRFIAQEDDAIEQAILSMLLDDAGAELWAIDELVREIGDRLAIVDAVRRLTAAGIVHHLPGGFVLISRTARRTIELWD